MPALSHGDVTVWESLAIGEYLAERVPAARLWPEDPAARALARAVSAEMHAGFAALREHLPMNIRSSFPRRGVTPEVQADINRITALWRDCRKRFGADGAFLFGGFTIADAMYAPVVSRFRPRSSSRRLSPGLHRCGVGAPRAAGMGGRRQQRADDHREARSFSCRPIGP